MKKQIKCQNGHTRTIYIYDAGINDIAQGNRPTFEYSNENQGRQYAALPEEYAYTHGGCCFQAACEACWKEEKG